MPFKYTPVKETVKDFFEIKIKYEHGDADATTYYEKLLYTENSLIVFLENFTKFANIIEKSLSSGKKIDMKIKDQAEKDGVPFEYDICFEGNIARMSIVNIRYVDAHGTEFIVEKSK